MNRLVWVCFSLTGIPAIAVAVTAGLAGTCISLTLALSIPFRPITGVKALAYIGWM